VANTITCESWYSRFCVYRAKLRLAKLDEKYAAKATDLRDHVDQYDVSMNGTIDRLLRDHLISAEMAS
jgi:hypothetical protein